MSRIVRSTRILSDEQKQILADAGNDKSKMIAPSAMKLIIVRTGFYIEKVEVDGIEVYEYSNDPNETCIR